LVFIIFNNILVICVGNICRSPAAERILTKKLPGKSIFSAGLAAVVDHGIDENVCSLLLDNGYEVDSHKAKKVNSKLIASADLILVMEKSHKNTVMKHYPESSGKIMLLGKWLDNMEIQDPYRKSSDAYQQVFEQLQNSCMTWYERLKDK
jgi:protein-tyrosine phosphatase